MKTRLFALAAAFATALGAASPAAAEEKIYSISVNPQTDDYASAFNHVIEAGARGQTMAWNWSDLEPSPGRFRLGEAADNIQFLCKEQKFTVLLTLMVIDGASRRTPSDLLETPFDSEQMKQRFRALIDSLMPLMDRRIKYIAIGSEVDKYLSMHPEEWSQYETFCQEAADYIHLRIPEAKVGVCVTHSGATGPDSTKISALNKRSDVWVTTYYPIDGTFRPSGPTAVFTALPSMVEAAAGLPVVVQEIGYPSAEIIGGSEKDQAEFVANTFDAWEMEKEKIPFLNFWVLFDPPPAEVERLAEEAEPQQASRFKAFLGSLGLRNSNGTAKAVWTALMEKAKQFGFIG
jgi:hypothetical protein